MKILVVLDIDIDTETWRATCGERTSADLEIAEYVYRIVAFSERVTCGAEVHQK